MARGNTRDRSEPSQRALRVGELVRHALSDMLARGEVHDPVIEGHLITVPEVQHVAGFAGRHGLRHAARRSRPAGGAGRARTQRRYLRGEIARRVNLKFAPDIRFAIDERFDAAERIEKLLRTPAVQRDLDHDDCD